MVVWCPGREDTVCPVVPLPGLIDYQSTLASTRCEEGLELGFVRDKALEDTWTSVLLPKAVGAEGVPAWKFDWIGPLAEADAALVYASVHWFLVRGQIRRATAS